MLKSVRSAALVVAALTASSVAPAKVAQQGESLTVVASATVPMDLSNTPLPVDPLAVLPPQGADPIVAIEPEASQPEDQIVASGSLSETVASLRSSDPGSRELECLAGAIYFESKSEGLQGQLAVGHVIANRTTSGKYPSTYCGVVYQRGQFSFVRGRSMPAIARGSAQWKNAVAVAKIVDRDLHQSPVGKALSFHARRVSPGWRMTRVATLGNHVFYR